jgi:hypothetical protein
MTGFLPAWLAAVGLARGGLMVTRGCLIMPVEEIEHGNYAPGDARAALDEIIAS